MRLYPDERCLSSQGIAAFGLHYWSAELGGLPRYERTGQPTVYQFRYDPTDISRIAVFRDGIWVGDGVAREFQQADGSVHPVSLVEWAQAKRLVREQDQSAIGKTPGELVLMTDLKDLRERRRREKKMMSRRDTRTEAPPPTQRQETAATSDELDEETARVLRFLY